jgi:peptide/nickel transport system ATP-binding protein
MLKGEQIYFRYGSQYRWILNNVSLEIAPSEVVGLTAPSGFGKTTLAKVLAGYLNASHGSVTVDNQPLSHFRYCPVQLVFQNPELAINPRWRIAKVLSEAQSPTPEMLQMLGVDNKWGDRYPHELSGGELQRIAVARVLNSATRYLIADEMTAMLDANTQALIWQAVLNYAKHQNIGLLVISHEAPLIKRLCDRVINLTT